MEQDTNVDSLGSVLEDFIMLHKEKPGYILVILSDDGPALSFHSAEIDAYKELAYFTRDHWRELTNPIDTFDNLYKSGKLEQAIDYYFDENTSGNTYLLGSNIH
jgi:hypothetical protein